MQSSMNSLILFGVVLFVTVSQAEGQSLLNLSSSLETVVGEVRSQAQSGHPPILKISLKASRALRDTI